VQGRYNPSGAKMASKNMMNHYRHKRPRSAPNLLLNRIILTIWPCRTAAANRAA
jgi:hypothetical protein